VDDHHQSTYLTKWGEKKTLMMMMMMMGSAMTKTFIHILFILYRPSVVSMCFVCVSVFSLWLDFRCVGSATVWDTTTSQGILWSTNRLDFWKICSQICSLEIDSMSSASWYIHILMGWSSILSLLRHRSAVYTGIHHHAILPLHPTFHSIDKA